jgi:hypothetical protein
MKKDTRFGFGPAAILVVIVAVLTLLAIRHGITTGDVEKTAVKVEDNVLNDSYSKVAVIAAVALFGYLMWTVLSAKQEETKAAPPAKESTESDKTGPGRQDRQ